MAAAGSGHISMLKKINYYWRVIATGISFCVFGLGGLLLRILVFPILNLLISQPRLRIMLARNIIRFAFRCFVELMRFLGVLRYDIRGLQRLERSGLLILANHPTLIDTVFLMAFVKQADCIVKSTLWQNPFTRGPVRAAGYICNDNGPRLVEDCIAALRSGSNLIIFPEGTRTPSHGMMKFKRGAANTAVRSLRDVTPVVIRCVPPTLSKGEKWWQVPPVAAYFTIEVQEDVNVQTFVTGTDSEILATRRLTQYLQNYFMKENQRHAAA
jgi:1-acyl-sn-glycerol-3-phosphate acyltransferase